jgi:hypothetical protein
LGLRNEQLRSMVAGRPSAQLIHDLVVDKNSEAPPYLTMLSQRFVQCCKRYHFRIVSFYEQKESPTVVVIFVLPNPTTSTDIAQEVEPGVWKRKGPKCLMVTRESATRIGHTDNFFDQHPLDTDHSKMAKFTSPVDVHYQIVISKLKEVVRESVRRIGRSDNIAGGNRADIGLAQDQASHNSRMGFRPSHMSDSPPRTRSVYSGAVTVTNGTFVQGDQNAAGDINFSYGQAGPGTSLGRWERHL